MLRSRIIPCLLIQDGRLVKTRCFKDPKYVGDPINAVKIFNEKEVDELILLDITAWKSGEPNYRLLEKVAVESRMPLCYGGGIKNVEQATKIVKLGFEKISISSLAFSRPSAIEDIAAEVGSQSVVVTLDVKREFGKYYSYTENGSRKQKIDLLEFCKHAVANGAGELVINSIDNEGEMNGYDLDLAKYISSGVSVPLTFIGGAGTTAHMASLINEVGVVGAGAGSMFVFKGPFRAVLISYSRP